MIKKYMIPVVTVLFICFYSWFVFGSLSIPVDFIDVYLIIFPIIIFEFLNRKKQNQKIENFIKTTKTNYRLLGAIVIDAIFYFIIIAFLFFLTYVTKQFFILKLGIVILLSLISYSNYFYVSFGYKIMKVQYKKRNIVLLFNNDLYLFLFIMLVSDSFVARSIAGFLIGVESIFFISVKKPFTIYFFKTELYSKKL